MILVSQDGLCTPSGRTRTAAIAAWSVCENGRSGVLVLHRRYSELLCTTPKLLQHGMDEEEVRPIWNGWSTTVNTAEVYERRVEPHRIDQILYGASLRGFDATPVIHVDGSAANYTEHSTSQIFIHNASLREFDGKPESQACSERMDGQLVNQQKRINGNLAARPLFCMDLYEPWPTIWKAPLEMSRCLFRQKDVSEL
ncbi:hypothetical protein ARMGADRAFT_736373 [Armillaria gallica]|uniref:Uncharacterized protein n=1 Tax=Armillaria gallica TaxID=47427 RepID=A0A2H3CT78_ARMGA|nr:hypothetical protein ARMGADRAFT_736373 [Armillaria gallica]